MKTRTVLAKDIHAGDRIVFQEGTIKKSYRINEVSATPKLVTITFKGRDGNFVRYERGPRHRVRIRA